MPYDMTAAGRPGCELLVSSDHVMFLPSVPQVNGFRGASATIQIPMLPALVGLTFHAQWAGADAATGDLVFSKGLSATIQP